MLSELFYFSNSVFGFLIALDPAISLFIISLITVTLSTISYKYFSDQVKIKAIKDDIERLNKEMKEHKSNLDKQTELSAKIIKLNFEMMNLILKPSLYTMIPMMLVFIWLSAVFSQNPILPSSSFRVDILPSAVSDQSIDVYENIVKTSFNKFELINRTQNLDNVILYYKAPSFLGNYEYSLEGNDKLITVSNHPIYFDRSTKLKNYEVRIVTDKLIILNLFGWKLGYLGSYLIFAIFINAIVRKLLNVY